MRLLSSNLSPFLCRLAQGPANEEHAPQTVIVGGDWIGDPRRISVSVDDPDRWNIVHPALAQHHPILQRIQANYQVRFQRRSLLQLIVELRDLLIELVENFGLALAQDQLSICKGSRRPSLEEMTAASQFSRFKHYSLLPLTSAHEQYDACSFSDTGNNAARPSQMGGCHIEGDDVDTLTDTKYIAGVPGIPERGRVA